MTSYDPVLICTRKDDVLLLTLNRGSKANSLTPALVEDLITALDQPVLRGADDKVVGKLLVYRKYGEVVA